MTIAESPRLADQSRISGSPYDARAEGRHSARVDSGPDGDLGLPINSHRASGRATQDRDEQLTPDWRGSAACRRYSTNLFFPTGTSDRTQVQIEQARSVCAECIVAEPCLAWAMAIGVEYGVWSGITEDERATLRRRTVQYRDVLGDSPST